MKKPEARSQKPVGRQESKTRRAIPWRPLRAFPAAGYCLLATGYWLLLLSPSPLAAQPTQEEVFKSIGDAVNEPIDTSRVIAVVAGIGGVITLMVVVGQWRNRDTRIKPLNHSGKLLKEVLRNVPLKGAELKQIKILCQDLRPRGTNHRLQSPLTLLLCPSLLGEAAKQSRGKADLPVVAGLVKKLVARS